MSDRRLCAVRRVPPMKSPSRSVVLSHRASKIIFLITCAFLLPGPFLMAAEIVRTYATHEDFFTKRYSVQLSGTVTDGTYQLRYENSADHVDSSLITVVVSGGAVVSGGSGFIYAGGYPLNDARVTIFMGVPSGTTWSFTGTQYAVPDGSFGTISGDPYAIQRIDTGMESGQDFHISGDTVVIKIEGAAPTPSTAPTPGANTTNH